MIKSVLFREDNVYKAFPDLVECGDGTWVCIYRESLGHTARPFGRIACHLSHDGGRTWSDKAIVDEVTDPETGGRLNNPRLLALDGSELLIICDLLPRLEPEDHPDSEIFIYRSTDSGRTWSGRASTGIRGHICPCIFRTRAGGIIIGGDRVGARDDPDAVWIHNAFTSTDGGRTWGPAVHVCSDPELWLNEGTYVELDDGTLVCYLREDLKRAIGYKAISRDGGRTWSGPFPTFLTCCVGRPRAGILRSGEVAVVHGFQRLTPPRNLVLHVETQEIAADPGLHRQPRPPGGPPVFLHRPRPQHPLRRRLLGVGAEALRGPVRRAVHQRRQPVRSHPRLRDRPLRLDPLPRGGPVARAPALARLHRQGRRRERGAVWKGGMIWGGSRPVSCRGRLAAMGYCFYRGFRNGRPMARGICGIPGSFCTAGIAGTALSKSGRSR